MTAHVPQAFVAFQASMKVCVCCGVLCTPAMCVGHATMGVELHSSRQHQSVRYSCLAVKSTSSLKMLGILVRISHGGFTGTKF